jgi:nucleotide-binding universal stress UspA family protein
MTTDKENAMKILVGYDGSAPAKEALKLARKHATVFGATIDVITSMEEGKGTQMQEIDNAERGLEWAKSLFSEKSIPCATHLLIRGLSPGEDLVNFAKDNKVDEIIVGVKRRSKVGKLLLGSTAQFVILEASCPVVSVK